MKRVLRSMIVSLVLLSVIGASAVAQVRLTFMWHGGAEWQQAMEHMATLFEERNPGIKIKVDLLPWDQWNEKWPIMIAGGTAPDLMGAHPAQLTEMVSWGFFTDVTAWVKNEVDWDDIVHKWISVYDDKIVGLPCISDAMAMRYNKDLFAEAGLQTPNELYYQAKEKGWNWEAFVEAAKKLTVDKNGDGRIDQYGFGAAWDTWILTQIRAFGGDIFNKDYTECILNRPEAKRGIKAITDLTVKHHVMLPPEVEEAEVFGFLTGKVGMECANTADRVLVDVRKKIPFKWDFCLNPAGPAGFRIWGDGDTMMINPGCKHKREAFEFVKWQASTEVRKLMLKEGIWNPICPVTKSIFKDPEWIEEYLRHVDPEIVTIAMADDYVVPKPFVPRTKYASKVLWDIMPTEIKSAWLGIKTADEAIEDMTREINELLQSG